MEKWNPMKNFILYSLIFVSQTGFSSVNEEIEGACGYRTQYDGTVFTLTISRSFHPWVEFKLCERKNPEENFILVSTKSKEGMITHRKIPTELDTYESLYELYFEALDYNVRDAIMGLDGSMWCLETRRGFTYSKACFWSPEYDDEKRGLVGLVKLGKKLWECTDIGSELGGLY